MKLSLLKLLSLAALVCLIGCGGGDDDNPADNKDNNSTNNGGNNNGGGVTYESVDLGGLKWMKKNLNIEAANSWCYGGDAANCATYGRLYTWEAAKTVCPTGWRLPSKQEWGNLVTAAGGSGTAGRKLKSKNGWESNGNGTDDYGFSAMPGGYRDNNGDFYNLGGNGYWWTDTEDCDGEANYREMYYDIDKVDVKCNTKRFGLSVRCVQ